eukprot:TRINITY_DN2045_c0_g1_i1.p1 TRINITY_DN2045_c0_g1~~TRINITY_DN2045_c0_g1_i1.p1  ORF type:complete len:330 (+),score=53.27 TRINITY_DN2045_c0_g1_i1:299-1288(+)
MKYVASLPGSAGKETTKLWRRITTEFWVELALLKNKWKTILFGAIFQYIHGLGGKTAHYLHKPAPVLGDMGFRFLPELVGRQTMWSEYIFISIFIPFCLWTFHPFFASQKRFYTVTMWAKVLVILVMCQTLRILSFTATQLPGPGRHCHEGQPYALLDPPRGILDLINYDVRQTGFFGCGDLIFSSHMTFTLVFVITYTLHGATRLLKYLVWPLLVLQSLFIIAARKHYSVDVVIAWYAVPLVYYFVENHLSAWLAEGDPLDRRSGTGPLLPDKMLKADEWEGKNGRVVGVPSYLTPGKANGLNGPYINGYGHHANGNGNGNGVNGAAL